MKLFLDSLLFLGQALALLALAWGGWLVLRESLAGTVFPDRKESAADPAASDRTPKPAHSSIIRGAQQTKRAA